MALLMAHAGFSALIVTRPNDVVAFIARHAASGIPAQGNNILQAVGKVPPYAWFVAGHGWDEFLDLAPDHPAEFRRLVLAVRLLGVLGLGVNLLIVVTTVTLTLTR